MYKVGILGPGAVGGAFAAHLINAHQRVVCVAPSQTVGLIALAGIALEAEGQEPVTVRPEVTERLVQPVSLLLITVKAPYLEDALERVEPEAVEDAVVLPLMNGLEHMDPIRERFNGRVAAGSLSRFEAYRVGRMQVVQKTPGAVVTMASKDLAQNELERAARILRSAEIEVDFEDDEKRVLWRKLARLAVLSAATALSRRTVGELRTDPEWRPRMEQALVEACAVAARRRRQRDPVGAVDADRGDGQRPHDLGREGRRSEAAVRDRRDRRLGRACRRAARRPLPRALPARGGSLGALSSSERAVAFVPARAGSERVPHKNVRPLAGHPLLAYAIETALQSGVFERVVVSTDAEEIAEVARWYGAEVPFLRPAEYATATSPDVEWLSFTLPRLGEEFDLFALVRATNPFRGPDAVRRGLEQLLATPEADSLRAVELVKQHPGKMWTLAEDSRTMTPLLDQSQLEVAWHAGQYQALPRVYSQNSALEIAWTRVVSETGTREGRVLAPFFTEGHEGFNVDDEEDWERAERLVASGAATLPAVRREPYPPRR